MRVVERPDVSKWTYKTKCLHCDSTLEITASDLIDYIYDSRDGSFYTTKCCVCNSDINVSETLIPQYVRSSLR